MTDMTLHRFLNALRILRSIDRYELQEIGVMGNDSHNWDKFRDSPFDYLLFCDDYRAAKIWAIVEARQPKLATPKEDQT